MKAIRQEQRSGSLFKEDWIAPEPTAGPAGAIARRLSLSNCLHTDFDREIERDVLKGMSGRPKTLPSKYFYDARGSKLFEEICCLPEYYPTRTEISILSSSAPAIMSFFERGPGDLVEIGCGADLKIRRLLEIADRHMLSRIRYVPLDISAECLVESARRLLAAFSGLRIHALIADFTRHLDRLPSRRKMIVFFGGTFGNFSRQEGIDLLVRLAERMGVEDRLILGLDMIKEKKILEAAYNDAQGVTAAFNLNILSHINRRLGADFDTRSFEHLAFWNEDQERIEMHLRASRDVTVHVPRWARTFTLQRGEAIQTEISQKFSRSSAQERFGKAGLHAEAWHTDAAGWFCLVQLRKGQAP
jgi:L-histidine Nalpha-methyltransferase